MAADGLDDLVSSSERRRPWVGYHPQPNSGKVNGPSHSLESLDLTGLPTRVAYELRKLMATLRDSLGSVENPTAHHIVAVNKMVINPAPSSRKNHHQLNRLACSARRDEDEILATLYDEYTITRQRLEKPGPVPGE